MILKIKRLKNEKGEMPPLPKKATEGSAGIDLYAFIEQDIEIAPRELVKVPTGICVEITDTEYVGLVFTRSSLGIKNGITLSNSVGVIDSDYRGEIIVGLVNLSDKKYTIKPFDRFAQLVLVKSPICEIEEVTDLNVTNRNTGGFGSTGR